MSTGVHIDLNQIADCIQGRIDLPADMTFAMECLSMVVECLAKQAQLPAAEVAQDLLALVKGKS